MANENYDAIVVGSGISGGWAAKELTEKGLTVLLLERGKNVEHVKDYVNTFKAPWEYLHRGGRTYAMEEAYAVLKRDYPLNERNLDWWVNEKESPYTEVKRFDWYRGYHVGGRSLLWGRQSYRWSDFDFEANAREGIGVDWPVRYAELAPWYDYVERFAGISGSREDMAQLPDGQFQPAMPLNCGEEIIAGRVRGLFDGRRRIIPGRVANLTQPLPGRSPCQYRNACWLGCPYGSYFSTQSSTLPAAMATGKLTLKPFSLVSEVLLQPGSLVGPAPKSVLPSPSLSIASEHAGGPSSPVESRGSVHSGSPVPSRRKSIFESVSSSTPLSQSEQPPPMQRSLLSVGEAQPRSPVASVR